MVENATPIRKRSGGRPPKFDREAVVSAAVQAFWSKGFEATTLADLEEATGVDRSSLYNSFGGKTGLYESAAAAYVALADQQLFAALYDGTDGLADIVEFIDRLDGSYRSGVPRGCFIVNDMSSVHDLEAATRYRERLRGGFRVALDRAAGAGQIDADSVERRGELLTAAFIGINLVHRNVADPAAAHALLAAARAEVDSWRIRDLLPSP